MAGGAKRRKPQPQGEPPSAGQGVMEGQGGGLPAAAIVGAAVVAALLGACCWWLAAAAEPEPESFGETFRELPPVSQPTTPQRHLGYMEAEQLEQLEALIEVRQELSDLPVRCAVCRVVALEAFGTAVKLGLSGDVTSQARAEAQLGPTLRRLCPRLMDLRLLGVMGRRAQALSSVCDELLAEKNRLRLLLSLAAEHAHAAAATPTTARPLPAAAPSVDTVCAEACAGRRCTEPLPGWAAIVEAVLGLEPLGSMLLEPESPRAFPDELAATLLFFSAAKSDLQAVRLVSALSGASATAPQAHGDGQSLPWGLAHALAGLMSMPSIQQQLRLLRILQPELMDRGLSDMEAFLQVSSARLNMRIDSAVNDTALHVTAYGYDHENLLMLLVRDGGAGVDTPDSLGRTALHYAADAQDQIAALVNVFAEPPPDTMPILAQRTPSAVRMAADLTQSAAVAELSVAQLETVKTLLAFGADARAQSAHTGSTPLHLAARSGATEVVRLLIRHGAALEARNSHGDTALITATIAGQPETCAALLTAGARVDARNALGRDARWYAAASAAALSPADATKLFDVSQAAPRVEGSLPAAVAEVADGGWGVADNRSSPELGDLCEVDSWGSSALTGRQFEQDYLLASRPVMVVGGADQMPAKATWTRDSFFARVGGLPFKAQKLPMWKDELLERSEGGPQVTLGRYFEEVGNGLHPRPLSWNNPRNSTLWREMERELSWPAAMRAPTVWREGADSAGFFGLFMGPGGSGVTMHHHKAAWNALVYGRKLWVLTPPAQSSFRRAELAYDSFSTEGQGWMDEAERRWRGGTGAAAQSGAQRLLFCVQKAGDVLFVPAGWGHSTYNLRESIGVANFFLDADAVGYRPAKIFHSSRGIRSLATALGMTSPSDFDPDGHP